MTKDELQKNLQNLGFNISEVEIGKWRIENEDTLLSIQYWQTTSRVSLILEGAKPSDEVLGGIVTYYETIDPNVLCFQTHDDFVYYHPGYYYLEGTLHKHMLPFHKKTDPFFKIIYDACVEEWKNDPLFSFTAFLEGDSFIVNLVKSGGAEQFSFKRTRQNTYEFWSIIADSQTFATQEECLLAVQQCLAKIEKSQRLPLVYQPSFYHTKRFFQDIGYGDQVQTVFDYLCQTHEWEEVEAYFRSLTLAQINHFTLDRTLRLLELMDAFVLLDHDKILFYPLSSFEEAHADYKACLFARVGNKINAKRLLNKYEKGEQI